VLSAVDRLIGLRGVRGAILLRAPALGLVDRRREAQEALQRVDGQMSLQRVRSSIVNGRARLVEPRHSEPERVEALLARPHLVGQHVLLEAELVVAEARGDELDALAGRPHVNTADLGTGLGSDEDARPRTCSR